MKDEFYLEEIKMAIKIIREGIKELHAICPHCYKERLVKLENKVLGENQ